MPRVNYKSDFDFTLALRDKNGADIGYPPCDFTVTLTSGSSSRRFVASCLGGVTTNCFDDGGQLHIVADNHGLPPGRLHATVELHLPDPLLPDGIRRAVIPAPLDIDLVLSPSDIPNDLTASLRLPLMKGEPFTYADFTPEQLAEHKRPAAEAAEECRATVTEAVASMQALTAQSVETLTATNSRILQAETLREAANSARMAEIDRLTANNGALLRGAKGDKGDNAAPIVLSQQEYDALTSEQRRGNIYYIW